MPDRDGQSHPSTRVGNAETLAQIEQEKRQALREWDVDPSFYTRRERGAGEIMPWDHFDVGVKKAGLLREWQRAGLGEAVTA